MIYDCFTFFNELDVLELRLNILDEVIDKFVLVEATRTHSNHEKPLYFRDNMGRYEKFLDKIVHVIVDTYPEYNNSWTYENYQRNCIINGLTDCSDDDIILLSDCDEIPRPETVEKYKEYTGVTCLLQDMYFYFLNYLDTAHYIWRGGTKVLRYEVIKNNLLDEAYVKYNEHSFPRDLNIGPTFTKIRLYNDCKYVANGGWHFSYLGGVEAIRSKLKAFAHQEYNTDEILDEKRMNTLISSGRDIFGESNHKFISIPINETYPKYLIDNILKYDHLICKEGLVSPSRLNKSVQCFNMFGKNMLKNIGGKPLRLVLNKLNSKALEVVK